MNQFGIFINICKHDYIVFVHIFFSNLSEYNRNQLERRLEELRRMLDVAEVASACQSFREMVNSMINV